MSTTVEEVYARYSGDVFRFAYWLCGDREEAQDILSETFIRLWAGEGEVRAATVKAYLFTIARNLFRQRARRRNRERALDDDLPSRLPATDARAEARDELDAVARILRELPESDRSALLMRAQHELPYEEIARVLDISVSAAKVKVHRARLKLSILRSHQEAST